MAESGAPPARARSTRLEQHLHGTRIVVRPAGEQVRRQPLQGRALSHQHARSAAVRLGPLELRAFGLDGSADDWVHEGKARLAAEHAGPHQGVGQLDRALDRQVRQRRGVAQLGAVAEHRDRAGKVGRPLPQRGAAV